jgi:4-amino-4-deoxy-L-arabinose transferase-like glycosyltransferase
MSELNKEKKTIRFIALNLFILFLSIYLLTAPGVNFYYTDTSVMRLQVAKSIIERLDVSVPEGLRGADGRDYSWFGIGSALLAIPFYIIGKLIGVPAIAISIMNQLFGAATIVLVFLFSSSLGYSRRASLLVAIFYGLGTMAWSLAKQPFDNTIETFFVLFSVYSMHLYVIHRRISHILLSAISLGIAFIARATSILVIPPLFILTVLYQVKKTDLKVITRNLFRDISLFSLAFFPFLGFSLWYNYYRFGSIFETGYQLIAAHTGIHLFTGTSLLRGLSGFLISPGKGFFYYSPIAILFFFSIKSFIKKHAEIGIPFILIMLSYLLFLSKYVYWHGDWTWGPRYLLVVTPFLIIPTADLFDSYAWQKKSFLKSLAYMIFGLSLVIQIAAVSVDFKNYFLNLQIEEKIKFTGTYVDGVMPTFQPPAETYFNWHRAPILAQFKFIYTIARDIKDYRYSPPPDNATSAEKIKANLHMNVFDFWWLYNYFIDRSYSGFIMALLLLLLAIYTATRLRRLSR